MNGDLFNCDQGTKIGVSTSHGFCECHKNTFTDGDIYIAAHIAKLCLFGNFPLD
jgi:hypothetical protein